MFEIRQQSGEAFKMIADILLTESLLNVYMKVLIFIKYIVINLKLAEFGILSKKNGSISTGNNGKQILWVGRESKWRKAVRVVKWNISAELLK